MNNPIPTTIEARKKLFDEKFPTELGEVWYKSLDKTRIVKNTIPTINDIIKSFNHESYNELLRAMVEEIEGMKKGKGNLATTEMTRIREKNRINYNQTLSTLQDKIKSYIK